ncbi:hypothetical protein [Oceanobacillus neutriphilus]|uniref:Uncharacterized protein n=1 Tax=Oceanobacillus neutriphilus TaxID=531815 RepID=A0ABQ2P193_9BACI|nr:hypothetical protein [Oceanobacillus neutriphilus]GGP15518.1 hypothetical protein GCM10011346_43730 [Oceanobacillus neutriphilus]
MFDIILFICIVAVIVFFVATVTRRRFKLAINNSLEQEAKRVPKLSDEALQKRIRQASKVHENKLLNGFIGLFFAKGYEDYKDNLMGLYQQELAKRRPL